MATSDCNPRALTVTLVGGPTALLQFAGLRLLTDPTFDSPGVYEPRPGVTLTKTAGPALAPEDLVPVDVVLLSHDQHKDNLDDAGRGFLQGLPRVLTTVSAAQRLGAGAIGLANWDSVEVSRPDGAMLRITGVPAQHGPDGTDHLTGEVTGFLLSGEDLPTVYVSGDNASLDVVRRIGDRMGTVDIAILFVGGAQMPYLGDAYLTLPSADAPEAARILAARSVVPIHFDSWAHFSDGRDSLLEAFSAAGAGERLRLLAPGEAVTV